MPQHNIKRPQANIDSPDNGSRGFLPSSTLVGGGEIMISGELRPQKSDYSKQGANSATTATATSNNERLTAPQQFNGASSFQFNPMMQAPGSVASEGQDNARWQGMNKNTVAGAASALTSIQNSVQNGTNSAIQGNPFAASTTISSNANGPPFVGGVDGHGKYAFPFSTIPFGQQQEQRSNGQPQPQVPPASINAGTAASGHAATATAATATATPTGGINNDNSDPSKQIPNPMSFEAFMNAAAMSAAAAASGMNLPPAAFAAMSQNGGMNIANMAQFMTSMNMNPFMAAAASAMMPGATGANTIPSQAQNLNNGVASSTLNPPWGLTGQPPVPQPREASRNEPGVTKVHSFPPSFPTIGPAQVPQQKSTASSNADMPRPPMDGISQLTAAAAAAAPPFASAAPPVPVPTAQSMSQQESKKLPGGTSIQQLGLFPAQLPTPNSASSSFNLQTASNSVPKVNPSASGTGASPAFPWPMPIPAAMQQPQQQQQELSEIPGSFSTNTGTPTPPWSNVSTPIPNMFSTRAADSHTKENGGLERNSANEPSPKRVRIDPALLKRSTKGLKNGDKKADKDDDESEEENFDDENQEHGGDEKDEALRKRLERNMREQHRSQKITNQIKELRQILSRSKIIYKPTKFSILKSASEYIQTLQENLTKTNAVNESMKKAIAYATRVASTGIDPAEQQAQQNVAVAQAQDAVLPNISATVSVQGQSSSSSHHKGKSENSLKFDKDSMKCHTGNITEPKDFKTVFELSPNPFAIFALDGTFVECNPAFERITQYPKSEIQQHSLFHYLKNDDMANIFKAMGRMLKNSGLGLSNQASSGETAVVSLESVNDESLFWTGLVYPHQDSEKEFELLMNITIAKSAAGAPLFLNVSMSAANELVGKAGQEKNP